MAFVNDINAMKKIKDHKLEISAEKHITSINNVIVIHRNSSVPNLKRFSRRIDSCGTDNISEGN